MPILIYAPGLGRYESNTAEGVSDVIAAALDRLREGAVRSDIDAAVAAPRGLRVGKSVVDGSGAPLLHVFELDYKGRLDVTPSPAGPPPPPGAIRSSAYALSAVLMLIGAARRGAKSRMAKLQLAYAFVAVGALMVAALVAIVSGLVAAGVAVPSFVNDALGDDAAKWSLGLAGAVVSSWAATRKRLLALAATTQQTMRYLDNEDRRRDTVAMTVDDALDGLRDNGWQGEVHLLGYSFGSLVLFDAVFPKQTSLRESHAINSVMSLTTIGCPIDVVRLFRPDYSTDRVARVESPNWHNLFIASDVFGSNLADHDDTSAGTGTALDSSGIHVDSIRYLDEELGIGQLLRVKGFTTHSGYWGAPTDASCFDGLLDRWIA